MRNKKLVGKARDRARLGKRGRGLRATSRGRFLLPAVLIMTWAGASVAATPSASQPAAAIFPTVTADALDKQRVTLPKELAGEANLLLLSFSREQSTELETWTAPAQALQHTNVHFQAYRIPVSDRANALFRWWANASLKSEETDPELWHWEIPIYVDKTAFRAQLGIADEKSVVALLLDRSGRVLWRATGASTVESRAALTAAAASPGRTR